MLDEKQKGSTCTGVDLTPWTTKSSFSSGAWSLPTAQGGIHCFSPLHFFFFHMICRGAASCDSQTWLPCMESPPQKSSSLFHATCGSVPSGAHQAGLAFGAHGTPAEPELPQTALIRLDLKPHRHGQQLEFCWDSEACAN